MTIHSHTPVSDVKYFKRHCSHADCSRVLHPDGLHEGLLILKTPSTLQNPNPDPTTAYDHELLFNIQDDFEVGGTSDTAAYAKVKRSYDRGNPELRKLLPSRREFDVAVRNFRVLVDRGRHHASIEHGVDNLFSCPICGDAETASLIADGTSSEFVLSTLHHPLTTVPYFS